LTITPLSPHNIRLQFRGFSLEFRASVIFLQIFILIYSFSCSGIIGLLLLSFVVFNCKFILFNSILLDILFDSSSDESSTTSEPSDSTDNDTTNDDQDRDSDENLSKMPLIQVTTPSFDSDGIINILIGIIKSRDEGKKTLSYARYVY
jgi:hypothetical protein